MMPLRLTILLAAALLLAIPLTAAPGTALPTMDIAGLEHRSLRAPAEFAVAEHPISLSKARRLDYRPLEAGEINRGITNARYWIRVRLENTGGRPVSWVLHHETSYLDHLDVFLAEEDGPWQAHRLSDRVPFSSRPLPHRTLALQHTTPPGGHTDLYIRLYFSKADALSLNLFLSSKPWFEKRVRAENLLHGFYFGTLGTLALLALVFALILRERLYIHYTLFLLVSMTTWAALNGYGAQYLWPDSVFWQNEGFHILYLLMGITGLQFSIGFLKTRQLLPRTHAVLRIMQGVMLLGIGLRFAGIYQPVLVLAYLTIGVGLLIPILGIIAYRRGLTYARWFSVAWFFYGLGLGLSAVSAGSTWLQWGMGPLSYAQASSVLEAFCLLIALGERLVAWNRDRRTALRLAS